MASKIELPPIFGKNSKDRLISGSGIVLTLEDKALVTRTNYVFDEAVEVEGVVVEYLEGKINEKCYIKKDFISRIGIAYDDVELVYFIAIFCDGSQTTINVESADKGNEVLKVLVYWWLGD